LALHERGYGWRAAIISAVLAAFAFVAFAFWSDAARFGAALARVDAGLGAALLGLSAANYALRAVRWRLFLADAGHAVPWGAAAANYVRGFALTTTPGKAGEAIRSLELKRAFDVPWSVSIAALLADRFSDVLALALLCGLGLAMLPYGGVLAAVAAFAVALALWVASSDRRTAVLAHGVARILPRRLAGPFSALAVHAGRLARGRTLALGLALSLVAWSAEAWALHLIVEAMGAAIPVGTAMGIYAIALLGGALFLLPGGLGSTEALMVLLLVQAGMDPSGAGAATVVSRVTTLWFAVVLGWIALATLRTVPSNGNTR
jgi:uncharacterized membrane protein YbhN (UPF0104 family)